MRLNTLLAYLPAPLQKIFTPEVIRFILVGGFSALLEFSLLVLLVEKANLGVLTGNVGAYAITNVFTYILTKRYVFNTSTNNRGYEALLFTLCLIGGLLVNQVVLWSLDRFMDYRVAKVIAILVTVVWNFFTRKYLVFRKRPIDAR